MAIKIQTYLHDQVHQPKVYKVYMLNDDYTSWDFCLRIISSTFHKTLEEADNITQDIHTKGKGLCGIYNHEVAETKINIVEMQAKEEGFPMKCMMQEV